MTFLLQCILHYEDRQIGVEKSHVHLLQRLQSFVKILILCRKVTCPGHDLSALNNDMSLSDQLIWYNWFVNYYCITRLFEQLLLKPSWIFFFVMTQKILIKGRRELFQVYVTLYYFQVQFFVSPKKFTLVDMWLFCI